MASSRMSWRSCWVKDWSKTSPSSKSSPSNEKSAATTKPTGAPKVVVTISLTTQAITWVKSPASSSSPASGLLRMTGVSTSARPGVASVNRLSVMSPKSARLKAATTTGAPSPSSMPSEAAEKLLAAKLARKAVVSRRKPPSPSPT